MFKSAIREIKDGLGRYLAIFAIIVIGVGFYAGLSICKEGMVTTADDYLRESNFFDFRVLSTLGFTSEDADSFRNLDSVKSVCSAYFTDALVVGKDNAESVFRVHSMPGDINKITLLYGAIPSHGSECIADPQTFGRDDIGKTIIIATDNGKETLDALAFDEYTIVGIGNAPQYMNIERGTTDVGSGRVSAYVYVPNDGFSSEYFHELYITVNSGERIYSDEYKELVKRNEAAITEFAEKRAELRYDGIIADIDAAIDEAKREAVQAATDAVNQSAEETAAQAAIQTAAQIAVATDPAAIVAIQDAMQISAEQANEALRVALAEAQAEAAERAEKAVLGEVDIPDEPMVYVLTRESNISYVSFENDSAIVNGIAKVFPVFFFLVAALMCVTTMSRMVEEQRTQIGVLKSLGYGNGSVISKFLIYAGSSGILGCVAGYFVGTALFPQAIWQAFHMLYTFAGKLKFVFDGKLLAAALVVTCLCIIGVTLLCCANILRGKPADLIRPKSPKAGKRTLLERVTPLWNRMSFLHKVSMRNLFRYKQRFFMMIIGIGGCTALLVAGFGILDSLCGVVPDQYDKITLYDAEISFTAQDGSGLAFADERTDGVESLLLISASSADISVDGKTRNISVIAPNADSLDGYMDIHTPNGGKVVFPSIGGIIVNSGMAKDMGMGVGDTVTMTSGGYKKAELTVSGVFENHIGNYAYVSRETARLFFDKLDFNGAYALFAESAGADKTTATILSDNNVSNVTLIADMKQTINDTMRSLNFVVLVIILCAGALAFVVMYNLTNINITERLREIASIKVLGFYENETSQYIFRENNILTVFGAAVGLLIGKFLHIYVMAQVNIEFIKFSTYIDWKSYIYSAALTLAFAFVMQILMTQRLTRINMAESLKTVE